ncbi:unnamed protein product [Candidula unifasciata]|uniref:Cadherin-like and PC-esterase domain-containing protein 1 n=1 Tax=Candidula unifasciata TaxID=100452 RepID=A0A8S3Z991_9EUPU|nr:unnamed protein product [Candidula unifasciata]
MIFCDVFYECPSCGERTRVNKHNSSWPYLDAIHTDPYIQLHPEFSPLTTDYRAEVSYLTTLVHLTGINKHCRAEVRLGDQLISDNNWANFSLGLGDNTAHISVVNIEQPEATILNVYRITFHRKPAGQISGFDELKGDYQVCSLKQDCSLIFSPALRCGLQPAADVMKWTEFLRQRSTLPQCSDDDSVSGEWMVPCVSCQNESSCYWKKAVWQSLGCQEGFLATSKLKDCLAGKRVLFIGDSTNRGILHYILQRVNGSLMEGDKTHSIHVYPDFDDGSTVFGFAYYPQFWHRPGVRPGLDMALNQLLNRTSGWSDRESVLVLGGVHWLAKHHFNILLETLHRDHVNKWTVIIKGLGAGFHQPLHGVHQLSAMEQQQLYSHNQALLATARRLGFSVVDTFSMTMSRFRDFLPGRCACHFHQVSPVQTPAVEQLWTAGAEEKPRARFHIQGDINAVYSEMVVNRMCMRTAG